MPHNVFPNKGIVLINMEKEMIAPNANHIDFFINSKFDKIGLLFSLIAVSLKNFNIRVTVF